MPARKRLLEPNSQDYPPVPSTGGSEDCLSPPGVGRLGQGVRYPGAQSDHGGLWLLLRILAYRVQVGALGGLDISGFTETRAIPVG